MAGATHRPRAAAALMVATLVLLPAAPAHGEQDSGRTPGSWTAGDQAPAELVLDRRHPKLAFDVRLPTGARQGPTEWYTFRLRAQVTFQPGGPERGDGRLFVGTNQRAVNLVTLAAQDDGVRLFYDGYLSGPVTRVTTGRTMTIDYQNYAQTTGIRGGRNTIEIAFDDEGRLVHQVRIEPVSGLTRTSVPPDYLALEVPELVPAEAGERFVLPYRVSRRGGRPDRPLVVEAEKAGGPLELTERRHDHGSVGNGRTGELGGVAAEPGKYQVAVTASGGYNEPSRLVLVDVRPARRATLPGPGRLLASGALVVVALAVLRVPLRRRRPAPAGPRGRRHR